MGGYPRNDRLPLSSTIYFGNKIDPNESS